LLNEYATVSVKESEKCTLGHSEKRSEIRATESLNGKDIPVVDSIQHVSETEDAGCNVKVIDFAYVSDDTAGSTTNSRDTEITCSMAHTKDTDNAKISKQVFMDMEIEPVDNIDSGAIIVDGKAGQATEDAVHGATKPHETLKLDAIPTFNAGNRDMSTEDAVVLDHPKTPGTDTLLTTAGMETITEDRKK
jgi:hypothetical protein